LPANPHVILPFLSGGVPGSVAFAVQELPESSLPLWQTTSARNCGPSAANPFNGLSQ
jgi:hypothetical protein